MQIGKQVNKEEVHILGKQYYEQIRAEMEANHWGRMVVIDVTNGNIEIDDDDLTATTRLFERNPNAMTWGERVGYRAPYRMGGAFSDLELPRSTPAND